MDELLIRNSLPADLLQWALYESTFPVEWIHLIRAYGQSRDTPQTIALIIEQYAMFADIRSL
jgi:hypothetical protein